MSQALETEKALLANVGGETQVLKVIGHVVGAGMVRGTLTEYEKAGLDALCSAAGTSHRGRTHDALGLDSRSVRI